MHDHRDLSPASGISPRSRSPRRALHLLCLAQLMLVVDITAVNIALPRLSRDLALTAGGATWVVSAYVVTFGALMLLGGRLSDVLGRRRVLLTGVVVFAAASLACGLAGSGPQLIAARAAQGAGAALMSPAALASIAVLFTGPARTRAMAAWATVGAGGFVGGLILSGALTSGPGWRWVFLINLPVCAALLVAIPALLPPDDTRPTGARIDFAGAALSAAALGSLVYGLGRVGNQGLDVPALLALTLAAAAAIAFVLVESGHSAPLIDPQVLRQGPVLTGLAVMLAASAAMLSIFFLGSMYAQHALDLAPLEAGLLFLPSAVATMLSAHAGAHLITRHGTRVVVVLAFAATALGAALLAQVSSTSGAWALTLVPGLVLTSLGLGPAVVVATSSTLARVSGRDAGVASGIVNTGHEVGGGIGLAMLSATIGGGLSSTVSSGYARGFLGVAMAAGVMALLSAFIVPSVRPDAEHLQHGH